MPIAKVQLQDGRIARFEVPEGTSQEEVLKFAETLNIPEQAAAQVAQVQTTPQTEQQQSLPLGLLGLPAVAAEGASFGFAPKIASAIGALPAKGAAELTEFIGRATGLAPNAQTPTLGEIYKRGVERYSGVAQGAREEAPILSGVTEVGGALAGGAGLAGTKAVQALGNLAGRYGLAGRIGAGALAGEASQRVYEAGTGEVGKELETLGREGVSLGGVLGGAVPAVGAGIGAVGRTLTPKIQEGAQEIINLAKKYDIPLGIDDLTDSDFYRHLIQKGSKLPFSGATSSAEDQLGKFTKAVARSVGLKDTAKLTPEAMLKAFDNVGKKFDDLTKGKTFKVTDDSLDAISNIEDGVFRGTYGQQGALLFKKYSNDIFDFLKDDSLDGDYLARLRSKYNKISRSGANAEAKILAKDFENVLVDMIGENAPEALRKAKYQYKNLIAIEPLAQKVQVDGVISPAQLTTRVRQVYGRQFTTGKAGELGDLARIGQAIKQQVPDSGSPIGNLILGAMTGGSLPLGFVNPAIPIAQMGATGLGLASNRALQARNVNPALIDRLSRTQNLPATISARPAVQSGIYSGQLGALAQ